MAEPLVTRKRLPDGTFGGPEKHFASSGETSKERMERLDADNATLVYENMMKDLKIEELSDGQADLIYQLMQKGVL
ncbi:hypothetical protein [Sporosarcina trichiuri]|uniref:hypothetical protein n=1 Tax=Sporosarcina trichiuri TaxID=3056445 RepID=UPI0025B3807B|nr:hypothetical protein [Sporosarcina sp. 0.2-SM1T-5]WJY27492.1 hypothetical protein QWT68_00275 [Sporosarcina sp. 0.2-SM1T-5]